MIGPLSTPCPSPLLNRHQKLRYSWGVGLEAASGNVRISQLLHRFQSTQLALYRLVDWIESR